MSSQFGSREGTLAEKPKDSDQATTDDQTTEAGTREKNKGESNAPDDGDNDPFKNLSEEEAAIIKRQVFTPDINVGILMLYRGAALPLMTVIFGGLQATFQGYYQNNISYHEFNKQLSEKVLYFVYLGIGSFVANYVSTVGFIYTGEHISAKIRERYLEHCLRQNIGFFDNVGTGEVVTRITSDTNLIQEGISQKVGMTLAAISTFVAAFVIGFIKYWKLTLILTSVVVALVLYMSITSMFTIKYTKKSLDAYAPGGSLIDEVVGSIRNAVAFGTQDRLADQYNKHLSNAENLGFVAKCTTGLLIAGIMAIATLGYALAFWLGGKYVIYDNVPFEKILVTVMSIIIGAFSIGNIAPNAQAFTSGLAAAGKVYSTIDRTSPLDPFSEGGKKLDEVRGSIRLENVKHIYPSRPEVVIMDNINLEIPAGKTTALVGPSGSGKSTIVGIIERFYEPVQGSVYLDGHDIQTLNLEWLRQQISLVSQEPTLFATTIYQNIQYGLIGTEHEGKEEKVQKELVIQAAKKANAHDFISELPEGYQTNVGDRGFLMSGGQKQRIAIARAIISNPRILLLDEATSALDTKSEGVVQAALEAASEGRTTIIIAHRLSTIKDAHNIVVMNCGQIVEQGTHHKLLKKQGAYSDLVAAQNLDDSEGPQAPAEEGTELISQSSHTDELNYTRSGPNEELMRMSTCATVSGINQPDADQQPRAPFWALTKLIASFNRNEKGLMLGGLFFSVLAGFVTPVQTVFLAKAITTLSTPLTDANRDSIKKDSDFWAAMYVMLAAASFITNGAHGVLFAKCSERLIHHARLSAFSSILRQDISFFDLDTNTSGAMTSFLSTSISNLAGLSGVTLGNILMVLTTIITGLCVGISLGWKLALVCTATVPLLVGCGFYRLSMISHFERRSQQAYVKSASYASEAISAIRTIISLTREKDVLSNYRHSLEEQQAKSLRSILRSSFVFALSEALTFFIMALCFWYGGTLLAKQEYTIFQFFVCFGSVFFSAQSAGSLFSYSSSVSKAYSAAQELKALMDRKPVIDAWSQDGERAEQVQGRIEFRNVHFRYPTRPEQPVLRGISLKVRPGQYVALVGASGCGKSTSIQLLERFYNPTKGSILLDEKPIHMLNINDYRGQIALVSQEPTLYQGTIRENISLGSPDENLSDERIKQACTDANIHDFIASLPNGLDTIVGSKGGLLSGGQKQRIAIARALIREPKILLLDEATSALDSESEVAVQVALDKAAKGRTTISVAHRLSSIQNADVIFVFNQGQIVEEGTHKQLIQRNGHYAELVSRQRLEDEI